MNNVTRVSASLPAFRTPSVRPLLVALRHRPVTSSTPTASSYEQHLMAQHAQGRLTREQVQAELEQWATDWEWVYTG